MALFKVIPNSYIMYEDVHNLFRYLAREDKNPLVCSNLVFTDLSDGQLEMAASQWCYPYKMYQPNKGRTMCYHYVVAFNLSTNREYNILSEKSREILPTLINIPSFANLRYFASAHRRRDNIPEHIHIIIDSLNHKTGKATYIPLEKLKYEIGETLWHYNIALAGYSYETHGRLRYGKVSPSDLYEEQWY